METEFQVGDTVLYGQQGVCQITELTEKLLDGRPVEYFVLKPVYDKKSTFFVPTGNEKAMSKMRRLLSAREIGEVIRELHQESPEWIENEALRKEQYKTILSGGDRRELIRLIKTLYLHQQQRQAQGKKMHQSDERFFREAEKLLYEEFAYVLNMGKDEVPAFIGESLSAGAQ